MLSDHGCSWGGVRDASVSPDFRQTSVKPQDEELEPKESDLVYVAHIEINNKCQMLWTCTNSHADEPTFQFWNAFTQHQKNHKHLLFPFGFQGARCLLSKRKAVLSSKIHKRDCIWLFHPSNIPFTQRKRERVSRSEICCVPPLPTLLQLADFPGIWAQPDQSHISSRSLQRLKLQPERWAR